MGTSRVPIVVDLDDDDDADEKVVSATVAVTPPPSRNRKRSLGATSTAASTSISSEDFLHAFSSSPPLSKRLLLAASAPDPIDLDDTPPPPPRRLPSSAPQQPVLVVDDDTDPSLLPETPELDGPRSQSVGPDIVVAETPGFTSPRLKRPPAARGASSAGQAKNSSGPSPPISLDSDDDDDDEPEDAIYRELIGSPSCKADKIDGTTNYDQPLHADLPLEDSTVPYANVGSGKNRLRGAKKKQNEEEKLKRQEAKRLKEEEKTRLAEERKQKQQENKRLKEDRKAELAEKKKKEKEVSKWESGKYALQCITAVVDTNVDDSGSTGDFLRQRLKDKGLNNKVTNNPIKKSVLWTMEVPNDIAQELSSLNEGCNMNQASVIELPYIAIVLEAEEFCDLVNKELISSHVEGVRKEYPTYTICYVTNKLMSHIQKCDQNHFKKKTSWARPPVEKVLCNLATHYTNVHSRKCRDEAEVAEHLVGLTSSLAKCKFRKQMTWLSVHANGAVVPDSFIDKDLAKKDTWLKSLMAIPRIQPRYALAIWKKYPSMRSLLNVYMDPNKTVSEKELLLSDLKWEGRLGTEGNRLGHKCSRRVYRMLMAENEDMDADPEEDGAP